MSCLLFHKLVLVQPGWFHEVMCLIMFCQLQSQLSLEAIKKLVFESLSHIGGCNAESVVITAGFLYRAGAETPRNF